MNNDTTDEQGRISQLYADNKAAFQAAQESANKGDWQSFEKTPVTNDTPADAITDIGKMKECPKCGLKAETLLYPFCTHKECPIRDYIKEAKNG